MYDVLVIGGGPAGVTAALRARELGASVALVERDRLGGTCTNDGCVPTRVLAHAARLLREAGQHESYGLIGEPPRLDFGRLIDITGQIVDDIHEKKQMVNHLEKYGVAVYAGLGAARFIDPHTIQLGDSEKQLEGKQVIICAGGHARRLPFPGAEHALTHSDVWQMRELPDRLAIIGAAATGCQLASSMNTFGASVMLLDVAPTLLPTEDTAVVEAMQQAFATRGIDVITEIDGVEQLEQQGRELKLVYKRDGVLHELPVDAVVLAVGWPGNLEPLNLPAAGVATEGNYIISDDYLRTSVSHIFAAGDIDGRMMLVQSATHEARVAVENALLSDDQPYRPQIVPHGGFTDPEYASVGLTEKSAIEDGHDVITALASFINLDRAVIDGKTEGFCKLVVSRETRQLLGAHVVGEQAVEIVQLCAAHMATQSSIEQLAELELAYPTYTAIVGLAARRAVHYLGLMKLSSEWHATSPYYAAEWERREPEGPIAQPEQSISGLRNV
jgi:pyruvate/2-oxoglutarate dehydrogenase complex dihydrolipoamide dehydrogenase (E3) component